MRLLAGRIAPGSTVLVVGGEGLVSEVVKAGFVVTRSADDAPAAVVQGFAPEVGWTQLAEAAFALKVPEEEGGIPWIATNTDWTIPQARGIAPGNGTLVSAVHTAIGRLATVAGKPEVPIFEAIGIAAVINLAFNALCLWLLTPYRFGDVNMSSAWECSRNDLYEGVAVLLAAAGVWLFDAGWPDLVIAGGLLLMFLRSSARVLRMAWRSYRDEVK